VPRRVLQALSVILCTAVAGCATPAQPPRAPAEAPRASPDWGALLFPHGAPAPALAPAPTPPPAPEPPPTFAPSAYSALDEAIPDAFPDVAAFCAERLRHADIPIS